MVDAYVELKAGFYTNQWYENLLAEFTVRHSASVELLAGFIPRRSTSVELKAGLTVRHSSSETLLAMLSVRHPNDTEVLAGFLITRKGWASQGLPASVYRDMSIIS